MILLICLPPLPGVLLTLTLTAPLFLSYVHCSLEGQILEDIKDIPLLKMYIPL